MRPQSEPLGKCGGRQPRLALDPTGELRLGDDGDADGFFVGRQIGAFGGLALCWLKPCEAFALSLGGGTWLWPAKLGVGPLPLLARKADRLATFSLRFLVGGGLCFRLFAFGFLGFLIALHLPFGHLILPSLTKPHLGAFRSSRLPESEWDGGVYS